MLRIEINRVSLKTTRGSGAYESPSGPCRNDSDMAGSSRQQLVFKCNIKHWNLEMAKDGMGMETREKGIEIVVPKMPLEPQLQCRKSKEAFLGLEAGN